MLASSSSRMNASSSPRRTSLPATMKNTDEDEDDEEEIVVNRNKKKNNGGRRVVVLDSDSDEDDGSSEMSTARGKRNAMMDASSSSSEEEEEEEEENEEYESESDVEFTTEDVREEEEEEDDDEFEDALDESFSNGAFGGEAPAEASQTAPSEEEENVSFSKASSSDDDDDEFEDMTPIVETVVKRPMSTSKTSVVAEARKISLFQAFRSPEAKRAFATTPTRTVAATKIVPVKSPVSTPPAVPSPSLAADESVASPSPPLPPLRSAPSPAPAPSSSTKNKPNNMRLKGKTSEGNQFSLDHSVAVKLYDHQRDAVRWLWDLQLRNKGGILADDMGLGKTMSSAAFIAGSLKSKTIKRALILAPTTLLPHWRKELIVCGLNGKKEIFSYTGTKEQRAKVLKKVQSREGEGSVLLCTYGMLSHNPEEFGVVVENEEGTNYRQIEDIERREGRGFEISAKNYGGKSVRFGWVVMDEGHQMKNPNTKIAQYVRRLPCDLRLVVSGTPIQNHLGELWALYDLAAPGLLGSEDQFRKNFARKITSGRSRDASESERHEARELSKMLRKICAPYFLRREKDGVLRDGDSKENNKDGDAENKEKSETETKATATTKWASTRNAPKKLGKKNDLVAWIPLSKAQKTLYEAFLQSPTIQKVMNKTGSALAALSALKKICDDPYLAFRELESATADEQEPSDDGDDDDRSINTTDALREVASSIGLDVDQLRENPLLFSAKLKRLHALLSEFKRNGKKVLVFSQSRYALDRCEVIAKKIFVDENQVTRIDGNVSANVRHDRVTAFQERDSPNQCMLLTTRVGGLGITLTAATRVIIFDPSWNPTTDNQSVDRAYRIGQTENVVVYRMITIGTVEEKTYRKQVFKQGIANDAQKGGGNEDFSPSKETDNNEKEEDEFRYFSTAETDGNVMFKFDAKNSDVSSTAKTLNSLHAQHREYDDQLKRELESTKGMFEVSDHDLLFSQGDSTSAGKGAGKVPDSKLGGGGKKKGSSKTGGGGSGGILGKGNANNSNWGGAGLLSSLAAKADAVAVNVKRRGSDAGEKKDDKAIAVARLQKLQKEETRTNELLSNQALLSKLPDNGERAHAKKQDLEKQIEQLRLSIESL